MTFLKDFTKIQKLHWLAFPHSYNNGADVNEKLEIYSELASDLKLLELIKQTCDITIREIQGNYYLFIGNSIKGAKPLTKEEMEILNGKQ